MGKLQYFCVLLAEGIILNMKQAVALTPLAGEPVVRCACLMSNTLNCDMSVKRDCGRPENFIRLPVQRTCCGARRCLRQRCSRGPQPAAAGCAPTSTAAPSRFGMLLAVKKLSGSSNRRPTVLRSYRKFSAASGCASTAVGVLSKRATLQLL